MPASLDPTQPLATYTATTCAGCPAGSLVHCHFRSRDPARFLATMLPPFVVGGAGIVHTGSLWLIPWGALCVSDFLFLEIRVMCSHCPHYAEPAATTLRTVLNATGEAARADFFTPPSPTPGTPVTAVVSVFRFDPLEVITPEHTA